jgi:hypothetical protein
MSRQSSTLVSQLNQRDTSIGLVELPELVNMVSLSLFAMKKKEKNLKNYPENWAVRFMLSLSSKAVYNLTFNLSRKIWIKL